MEGIVQHEVGVVAAIHENAIILRKFDDMTKDTRGKEDIP